MTNKRICDRCGLVTTKQGIFRHTQVCQRLPLPDVLAREMIDGGTLHSVAKKYSVSSVTIKTRVLQSALAEDIRWRKGRRWRNDGRRKCACGVLLDSRLVPFIGGDKCAWCEAEARGLNMRRMVMA